MSMGGGEVRARISGSLLVDAYRRFGGDGTGTFADDDGYPAVRNFQGFVDTVEQRMRAIGGRGGVEGVPSKVTMSVEESPESSAARTRYRIEMASMEAVLGRPRTYAIALVYVPTGETEALSLVGDAGITWSAGCTHGDGHRHRAMYYAGLMCLLAEGTEGFERDPEPDAEISFDDLSGASLTGLPDELIDERNSRMAEAMAAEINGGAAPAASLPPDDEDGGEPGYAGVEHNAMTVEEDNELESVIVEDMTTSFLDDMDEFDVMIGEGD